MADSKTPPPANNDVSQPGKTPPPETSKPVIITNRAVLKDPMVLEPKPPGSPETVASESRLAKASAPVKLRPLEEKPATNSPSEAETKPPAEATTPDKPRATSDTTSKASPAEAVTPATDQPTESSQPEASEGDAEAKSPTDPAALEAEEAERAKQTAHIQKLADSKKYYLPINALEKRRSKRALVILLVFLALAAVWADIAMDAGMLHIRGLKPITHFFPDK